jgi:hypothetical protein
MGSTVAARRRRDVSRDRRRNGQHCNGGADHDGILIVERWPKAAFTTLADCYGPLTRVFALRRVRNTL